MPDRDKDAVHTQGALLLREGILHLEAAHNFGLTIAHYFSNYVIPQYGYFRMRKQPVL